MERGSPVSRVQILLDTCPKSRYYAMDVAFSARHLMDKVAEIKLGNAA